MTTPQIRVEEGRQCLHEGRLDEAEGLLKGVLEQQPDYILARKLLGWVAAEQQNWGLAAEQWRTVLNALDAETHCAEPQALYAEPQALDAEPQALDAEPQALAEALTALATALMMQGDFAEASDLLNRLEALCEDADSEGNDAALTAALESRASLAGIRWDGPGQRAAWQRYHRRQPQKAEASLGYLAFQGEEDGADKPRFTADHARQTQDAEAARRILAYLELRLPRSAYLQLSADTADRFPDAADLQADCIRRLELYLSRDAELDELQTRARAFRERFPNHPQGWRLLANAAVAANDMATVEQIAANTGLNDLHLYLAAKRGDEDQARAIASTMPKRYFRAEDSRDLDLRLRSAEPPFCSARGVHSVGSSKGSGSRSKSASGSTSARGSTSTRSGKADTDRILLFASFRNERDFMPWFLEHYRALGVEWFILVDNDSTDGTPDFLLQQKDVTLFQSSDSYMATASGVCWINELIRRYGKDNWCIFVDADEQLIIPAPSLRDLVDDMAARGEAIMPAISLDTYPEDITAAQTFRPGDDALSAAPLIDPDIHLFGKLECSFFRARGGARQRLFDTFEVLEKNPILRGGRAHYRDSSHHTSYAPISRQSCALLHHKILREVIEAQKSQQDTPRNQRGAYCRMRHARYRHHFQQHPLTPGPNAIHYESPSQLQTLGLLGAR